jgi:hypothetical protein
MNLKNALENHLPLYPVGALSRQERKGLTAKRRITSLARLVKPKIVQNLGFLGVFAT